MKQENELKYYEKIKSWDFDRFEIETESLTNWDLYEILNKLSDENSKILDLGTGGGEKILKYFPECDEILGTDFSPEMINTANQNLLESGKKNISFKVMDNLKMDVPENYFDVVVARHTVTDPVQIYRCLKPGGYLLIRGVDMYDCWALKKAFGKGQAYHDEKPISITDYENVLDAGFRDVELVPIHVRELFKNKTLFEEFLKTVPIIDDFSVEKLGNKEYRSKFIDQNCLVKYVLENTHNGKIKLLRRYYGITARK